MIGKLSTPDFILRAPEPEDLDCMLTFENAAEQWSSNAEAAGPYSRFQMKLYIESCTNNIYEDRQLRLLVENKEKRVIGIVDIFNYEPFANKAEIGIIVIPEFRNKGIGEKILAIFSEHCFVNLGIHMLYAYIAEENLASRRLFDRCGFRETAKIIDWGKIYGKYYNAMLVQKVNPS
ncbi:GNAT family N-acetyltransferase [Phocaeicola paurosaccharolyticus]|uniref:GNAT family N-acetyltransferase n=1 Tax=Phocaeicola paurosaccharolyticus TaxID=732242 RepID=UPI002FE32289